MPHYEPPKQSRRGQLIDAGFILALIFVTLFVTTFVTELAGESSESGSDTAQTKPLSQLPINDTERAQYRKLIDSGTTDLAAVNSAVEENQPSADKYDINIAALLGTVALLGGYLVFVYRASFREYREVIDEKFGPREAEPQEGSTSR
jgi:hypothetical protein